LVLFITLIRAITVTRIFAVSIILLIIRIFAATIRILARILAVTIILLTYRVLVVKIMFYLCKFISFFYRFRIVRSDNCFQWTI